jgi:hypothetical protein
MIGASCIAFQVGCETLIKGGLAVVMGFVLFVGSVYLLLSAVFGRWMGYLVLMVAFAGWMVMLSALWMFGFFSQGLETPTNLGPRGSEPGWIALGASLEPRETGFPEFATYPDEPWHPGPASSVGSVESVVQDLLAEEANHELGVEEGDPRAIPPSEFVVQDVRFATARDSGSALAAATAFYRGGGPAVTVFLRYDAGSVPRYSLMFLVGSIVLLAAHLPLLDRAERSRKEILTGGTAPPWYGPA